MSSGVRGERLLAQSGRRLEPLHPRFVSEHPTAAGWIWVGAMVLLLAVCNIFDLPHGLRMVISAALVLPSLLATLLVLSQTPRTHLEYEESILGHFASRFVGLMSAVVLWMGSVVVGAAVAVQLTTDAGPDPDVAWDEAAGIFATIVPTVIVILWAALVLRCVSYLARLRGWAAVPSSHRIPDRMLAEVPRTRRVVIGLAHPGLLLVSGLFTVVVGFGYAGRIALDFIS